MKKGFTFLQSKKAKPLLEYFLPAAKRNSGFTLIEILIVIALMSVIGVVITEIFVRTLKGSNQVQLIDTMKQNGQAALDQMDRTIRAADKVVCVNTSADTIVVLKDKTYSRYRFVAQQTTANGKISLDNPTPSAIDPDLTHLCTDPQFNITDLTDTNPDTGVSIIQTASRPYITRFFYVGFKDIITIEFTVRPGVNVPPSIVSQINAIPFRTTVELR